MAKKKTVPKKTVPKKTVPMSKTMKTATAGKKAAMKTAAKRLAKPVAKLASKTPTKMAAKSVTKTSAKAVTKTASKTGKTPVKATAKLTAKAASSKATTAKPVLKLVKNASSLKFDFQPLDDRILVEREAESTMTAGGLYIPDTVTERPTKGVVKAVGRGHQDKKGRIRPLDVKVGDTVLFTTYAGSEVEFAGGTYLILRETDLLGVSAD